MRVVSEGIVNGTILDRYGKRGTQFNENGVPSDSLPFEILDAPIGTKSFAVVLEDRDAIPVTRGFAWIHWTLCNLTRTRVADNESRSATDFVQGLNSWPSTQGGGQSEELSCFYGGMSPPDAAHLYQLHVFALDTLLPLKKGFWANALYHAMDGHILDQSTLSGIYGV